MTARCIEAVARMRRDLAQVRSQLGEPGGAERTAKLALSLVGARSSVELD